MDIATGRPMLVDLTVIGRRWKAVAVMGNRAFPPLFINRVTRLSLIFVEKPGSASVCPPGEKHRRRSRSRPDLRA